MIKTIGVICVGIASLLDTLSQFRQIRKTLRIKQSSQISSTAYIYKVIKVVFSMTGLAIFSNWVGLGMEGWMLVVYITALYTIIKFKPKDWTLW